LTALAGRTAVITGASRGIGAAIAETLAENGARVGLLARSVDALNVLAGKLGNGAFPIECDVTNRDAVANAVDEITRKLSGPPDILVNNAGLFAIQTIDKTSPHEFDMMLSTNLSAPFAFVHAFLPSMRGRSRGHIVTIGSIADRHIFAGNSAYSAAKFGARALHEVLRAETRGSGVRASLISPAAVDTDIWDPIQYLDSDARPDRSAMLLSQSVADAVLYAVSRPPDVNVDELRISRA
jgi:NADP-dependent 3-hydroxy acid dehydrogenase YdfG